MINPLPTAGCVTQCKNRNRSYRLQSRSKPKTSKELKSEEQGNRPEPAQPQTCHAATGHGTEKSSTGPKGKEIPPPDPPQHTEQKLREKQGGKR